MSICVAFNLSDGVVIAVDSATTMLDGDGNISKVFPDVDKLFQLGDLKSGIACAKFLVDFVLGHYRFAETHPIVGGKSRIGTVTYSQNAFQILDYNGD